MSRHDHIDIFFSEEDGDYIADVRDLASCSAFGETAEETLREVERARDAWLAAAHEAVKSDREDEGSATTSRVAS